MIMLGFLYKYIIAYFIQVYAVNPLQLNLHGFTHMWLYMYAYSFYLFFDFAGYSLFAIAVSYYTELKRHRTLINHSRLEILKISGTDGT